MRCTSESSARRFERTVRLLVCAFALSCVAGCGDPWPEGPAIESDPVQVNYEELPSWRHGGTTLEAIAEYEVEAVVLSRHGYRFARLGRISPFDLALGWGVMSEARVLRELDIAQRNRWYFYRWKGEPPAPIEEMESHSSNTHIIPANERVLRDFRGVEAGTRVWMRGRLVNVETENGSWRSSRSRTDRGDGACEIMFVEEVQIRR